MAPRSPGWPCAGSNLSFARSRVAKPDPPYVPRYQRVPLPSRCDPSGSSPRQERNSPANPDRCPGGSRRAAQIRRLGVRRSSTGGRIHRAALSEWKFQSALASPKRRIPRMATPLAEGRAKGSGRETDGESSSKMLGAAIQPAERPSLGSSAINTVDIKFCILSPKVERHLEGKLALEKESWRNLEIKSEQTAPTGRDAKLAGISLDRVMERNA